MKNGIKLIRIGLLSILLLMLSGHIIVEYVDDVKIRLIIFIILFIVIFILAVILLKSQKCAILRVSILDILNLVIFVGLIVTFGKGLSEMSKMQNAFQGNNGFISSYSKSIGGKGYEDIESAVRDAIEYREEALGQSGVEEIYRIQVGEKVFTYLKEIEDIVEVEFFRQDASYYRSGSKVLTYNGTGSSEGYTTEETIKKDIANTMWRGVGNEDIGVPAWGVSCDERIFSMTVNGEKVEDIICIDEKNGKKYYLWIMTNIKGIKTIDDVNEIKIESE